MQVYTSDGGSADVETTIDGEREEYLDRTSVDTVSLGDYPIGTLVNLNVRNSGRSERVTALFFVSGCALTRATCNEAGCEASAELVVSLMDSRGQVD